MDHIVEESRDNPSVEENTGLPKLAKSYECARVGRDLTWLSQNIELPPHVGHEEEIERMLRRLCAPRARSLLVIGDSGTGKTALIQEIAARVAEGRCPGKLRGARLIQTSFADMWSHAGDSQNWAGYGKILRNVIKECTKHGFILVMEEFHITAQFEYSMSFLRPVLSSGDICILGTATERGFYNFLEPDSVTAGQFETVRLRGTSAETTREILTRRGSLFETETGYPLPDPKTLGALVQLVDTHVVTQAQPGKSIALLERTAEMKRVRGDENPLTEDDVLRSVAETVGVDYELLNAPGDRLREMEDVLNSRVLGQEQAIAKLCRRLHVSKSSLSVTPDHPVGVFMAVGPTGVGKSLLADSLAEFLTGSVRNVIRLDMNAYVTPDAIYAITGVPGEQSTERRQFMPPLTRQLKSRPYSVVLLDEIEKAHPKVLLLFLQAIDSGRFADNLGNEVSLRGCIVLMTSNVGFSDPHRTIGLMTHGDDHETKARRVVKERFPKELVGRIDEVLVFRPLDRDIMRRFVSSRVQTLENLSGKTIELTAAAMDTLCEHGFRSEYGARELNRTIDNMLGYPLALLKHSTEWTRASRIRVDAKENGHDLVVEPYPETALV